MTRYPDPIQSLNPTEIFNEAFWHFAVERSKIYYARLADQPAPWTSNSILSEHKFTNTFRAADRESQKCIEIAYTEPYCQDWRETFFRVILFKFFNKTETLEIQY